jgi:hypothetical protein
MDGREWDLIPPHTEIHSPRRSLQAAMELTRNEFDIIANNRMRMVDELIDRVLAPIQSFAEHYKHIRDSVGLKRLLFDEEASNSL